MATDTNFYYYRQKATLPEPAVSLSANSNTSVTVSWAPVEGADYYRVYAYDKAADAFSLLQKTRDTSFMHKGLESTKTYFYLVRAFYRTGEGSAFDKEAVKSIRIIPAVPAVSVSDAPHSVTLSWEQYFVYAVDPASGQMQLLAKTGETGFVAENLEAQTQYAFLVLAVNAIGQISNFEKTDILTVTTPAEPAPEAECLTAVTTPFSNAVKLSWDTIEAAAYYRVYSFDSATGKYQRLAQTTDTAWTHKALKANTRYTYLVRYFLADGTGSDFSKEDLVSVKTNVAAPKPKLLAVNESTVKLSWNKVAGAASYKVYSYNTKSGKYTLLGKTTAQEYSFKKAKYGQSYSFLVRAFDADSVGSTYTAANRQSIKIVIAKAALKLTSPKKRTVKLTWSKVPMAAYYKVYRYQGGKYKAVVTTKALSYTAKGLASGKKASFLVRAYTTSGKAASFSTKDVKTLKVK